MAGICFIFWRAPEWKPLVGDADDPGLHACHLRAGFCLCQPGDHRQRSQYLCLPGARSGDDLLRHHFPHSNFARMDASNIALAAANPI